VASFLWLYDSFGYSAPIRSSYERSPMIHPSKQILILARQLIQDVGFAKGLHKYYMDIDGRQLAYTSLGAIFEASSRLDIKDANLNSAINTFIIQTDRSKPKNILTPIPYLSKWNDNKDRSKQDVIAMFDAAIECFGELEKEEAKLVVADNVPTPWPNDKADAKELLTLAGKERVAAAFLNRIGR
jgi:hypothetical protein